LLKPLLCLLKQSAVRQGITHHRHTQDTDAISNVVLAALYAIPRKFKDEVKHGGCKILVCPTILEANPHLANNKAAG